MKEIAWEYYNPKEYLESLLEDDNEYDDEYEDFKNVKKPKIVDSPFVPNDLWIGHTNFKLTQRDVELLNFKANGLDSFKILSPYKFIVIPAKMFKWTDVRLGIEKLLCNRHINYTNNLEINNKIQSLKTKLNNTDYWAIAVLPNGEHFVVKSDMYDELFKQQYSEMKKLTKYSNAILVESELCRQNRQKTE